MQAVETLELSQENELRSELALCYRLVDFFGWTEMIFNHISVRLPGGRSYLVNPFGLNYNEVTPDNLLTVDVSGHLIGKSNYKPNPAGFALHGAIHSARPDMHCVIHAHTTPMSAVAQKEAGLSHDNFYGAQLAGRVGYHAFEGITLFDDERERMLKSLGDGDVLILRNHGVAVGAPDIPRAFMLLWTVQRACEIQCQAGMIPGPDTALSQAVRDQCVTNSKNLIEQAEFARLFFDAAVRRMIAASGKPF
ncbi:class II aldolase/adducin family protein [Bradyrhizobium sp. BRP22]|uniref:class II aldolase/adducin family protein n=1 Tax=Bradyrhizobium sp. BRP22 TaxID=2793821 RepID=UPI001CD56AEC|nr:class II aldolase/adducin family protein [Bradyrhizobium sp. BRP22]MCA1452757.1 class II aldolase/adducin family protein [Bradyrhizobium sp. BRP22]